MFTSAINYLASSVGGTSSTVQGEPTHAGNDDPLVGSVIDVGDTRVFIQRRIGEGGFAFVYQAEDMKDRSQTYALKRLLAMDMEKRQQIIQEIAILKGLSSHDNIVRFVTAATVDATTRAACKCDEFLVLMEFCPNNLADIMRRRSRPFTPATVSKVFSQVVDAVSALHSSKPPIIHRDLKLENLLVDSTGKKLKLCDFGSATTRTFQPTSDWSMGQRTNLEEEMARHTTPMYRAPEMLDMWANYPIDAASDIWALGCILYFLCFHQHPFEDSAKLAIINGNYRIPSNDFTYGMFHDLIKQMLVVDPSCRPSCNQILEHLTSVSLENGIDFSTDIDLELNASPSPSPLLDMSPQETSPQHKQQNQQQIPTAQPVAGLMSSLRGGAGQLMRNLRDTSKAVIQSVSVAGRGLDLHCITERLAAMSYPSDGFESAFRHHIDDVSQAVENCHANHYAIINLTERRYNVAKFQTGVVFEAGWKTSGPTGISTVLDTAEKCLQFLQKDPQNVIVAHCLDGRSNTAILISVVLMLSKFVGNYRDALKFYELKRCAPILENYHKTMLKYVEKAIADRQFVSRGITLTSIVLEPVPLFTKQNDGCRPYVQVVRGDEIVTAPSSDFTSLQQFTTYDEDAVLKLNIKTSGDVFLSAFHARQSFGGLFSKMDGVPMCKLYFHTGFLPTNASCLKFKLRELDGVPSQDKFGPEFKAVVNYRIEKEASQTRPVTVDWDLALIFNSKSDYQLNRAMMYGKDASPASASPSPPVAPPRAHRSNPPPPIPPKPEVSRTPSPVEAPPIIQDLLIEPSFDLPPKPTPVNHNLAPRLPPKSFNDSLTRPASDTLLLDLGFNGGSNVRDPSPALSNNPSIDILLDLGGSGSSGQSDPFFKPADPVKHARSSTDLFGGSGGGLGSQSPDLFGDSLLGDVPKQVPQKPVLPPVNAFQKPVSVGDELLSTLLGDLDIKAATSSAPPKSAQPPPSNQSGARRPNYNSAFFQAPQGNNPKGKISQDTFNDLLGGFSASNGGSGGGSKTIGEMKKKEVIKHMDPNEATVYQWKEGKSRNLRALLCSLDTIIWADSRWTGCGMHQLITATDVKKMYKKACLAVHPDKQSGTVNEDLAKLIFMELNDAWSEFEKQQEQIGI